MQRSKITTALLGILFIMASSAQQQLVAATTKISQRQQKAFAAQRKKKLALAKKLQEKALRKSALQAKRQAAGKAKKATAAKAISRNKILKKQVAPRAITTHMHARKASKSVVAKKVIAASSAPAIALAATQLPLVKQTAQQIAPPEIKSKGFTWKNTASEVDLYGTDDQVPLGTEAFIEQIVVLLLAPPSNKQELFATLELEILRNRYRNMVESELHVTFFPDRMSYEPLDQAQENARRESFKEFLVSLPELLLESSPSYAIENLAKYLLLAPYDTVLKIITALKTAMLASDKPLAEAFKDPVYWQNELNKLLKH